MTEPLAMPPDYNPKTHLLYNETENGLFHESRRGAWWARQLVANGTAQDLALAEKCWMLSWAARSAMTTMLTTAISCG